MGACHPANLNFFKLIRAGEPGQLPLQFDPAVDSAESRVPDIQERSRGDEREAVVQNTQGVSGFQTGMLHLGLQLP